MQRFITVFPTKLCRLYLSPMKCIISLSKLFHAARPHKSKFFPAKVLHYMAIKSLYILQHKSSYLYNIPQCLYYTYYPQFFNRTLHTYQMCSSDGMTYSSRKNTIQHWLIIYLHIIAVTQRSQTISVQCMGSWIDYQSRSTTKINVYFF